MPAERIDSLAAVLAAIRSTAGMTQPLLTQQVGLGRSVVAARIAELEAAGLVVQAGMGPSTGGRARAAAAAGGGRRRGRRRHRRDLHGDRVWPTSAGRCSITSRSRWTSPTGPEVVLVAGRAGRSTSCWPATPASATIWGVGIGVPGPVEFSSGSAGRAADHARLGRLPDPRAVRPARFGAPTWVDNDVNLLALGELRTNPARRRGRRPPLREDRYGHRRRPRVGRPAAPRRRTAAPATSATWRSPRPRT